MDKTFNEVVETMEKRWKLTNDDSFYRGALVGLQLALNYEGDMEKTKKEMEVIKKELDEIKKEMEDLEKDGQGD